MADISHPENRFQIDRVWVFAAILPLVIAVFDWEQAVETVRFAVTALAHTGVFIAFAVLAVGYLKASGSETLLARAFEGRERRMIVMAAMLGGLSPFCSCEVIPFIAALLAVGAPLSAVMAFWLASPLMDPAMFLITAGTLGFDFAVAKTISAVGLGLLGGATVYLFARSPVFVDPLKAQPARSGCCGVSKPFQGHPVWKFWNEAPRREVFGRTILENALFLGKWLLIAYMIEALMLAYIPAETIAGVLGGEGLKPVILGALVGAPAYLNGYAAVPLVDALLAQGMAPGAAMSFVLAGGVSCIPAAVAVWALVKPRVFVAYLGIAMVGSLIAGLIWGVLA
ncbi:MAG: permease [Silicimonas sp.]|nr:permease [Silicimonas sp.]